MPRAVTRYRRDFPTFAINRCPRNLAIRREVWWVRRLASRLSGGAVSNSLAWRSRLRKPVMANSPESTAMKSRTVSASTGLKRATRVPSRSRLRHSSSSSCVASPVSGALARASIRRRFGHLGRAPEMLHRLAHRAPARVFLAVLVDDAQNLELPGIVDLDPQDILVIGELDRVGLEPELDPTAFGP